MDDGDGRVSTVTVICGVIDAEGLSARRWEGV